MKAFEVTIPAPYDGHFGAKRKVLADYHITEDGALLFFDTDGAKHWLAGGDVSAAPELMRNEFPRGFWAAVTEVAL